MGARIWRYDLPVTDRQVVRMPRGARILPTAVHSARVPEGAVEAFTIWALVDDVMDEKSDRFVTVYGTGNPIPPPEAVTIGTGHLQHVGTYARGPFVWHVFVEGPVLR